MKIKLLNLMYINIFLLLIIFSQCFFLSYTNNYNEIPDIEDALNTRGTIFELLSNVSKSFTYYMKYTFYIYGSILLITIISTFLFRYGYKNKKISKSEILWQKQVVLLNIFVNLAIILYNTVSTDLILPKYESPIIKYILHILITPFNLILYIIIISYFVNNYSLRIINITNKINTKLEKFPLNWIS